MTNYNERLDDVLGIFSGGITGKGSDRGGYPTYFTEPYPIWCEARKKEAKQAILDWHNKQVEEAMAKFHLKKGVEYDVKASDSVIVITHTNKLKERDDDKL